jgi:hypothetical protein
MVRQRVVLGAVAVVVVLGAALLRLNHHTSSHEVRFRYIAASRGDFDAAKLTAPQLRLKLVVEDLPETVTAGELLRFLVEFSNPTADPIPLRPCPIYGVAYGESATEASRFGQLNCSDAPRMVPANGEVRFAMELPVVPVAQFYDGFGGTVGFALANGPNRGVSTHPRIGDRTVRVRMPPS